MKKMTVPGTGILILGILCLLLWIGGIRCYVVVSGSMEPAIRTGSLILVQTNYSEHAEGDIITFLRGEAVVTHRITGRTEQGYITGGDANNTEDEGIVTEEEILGRFLAGIPYLGYGVWYLKKPSSIIGILLLILSGILSDVLSKKDTKR